MPNNNKYGSIVETLYSDAILNILLSSKATPPADLNLATADFTAKYMYGSISTLRRGDFALGDVPRIVGMGLWCNIADGLVQIDNPADYSKGLSLAININSFNSAGTIQQTGLLPTALIFKIPEFNQIYDTDYLLPTSALNYTLTGQPGWSVTGAGLGSFRIQASFPISSTAAFSTISVDPLYAAKRLIIRPMLVVEHTYPFFSVGF